MNLQEIIIQPVQPGEQKHFQSLMATHHYLGALPKIGHTLWYNEWLALLSFSAAAWKCAARDQWIGWSYRYQYDRLHLIANNSRFLILPGHHYPNLASRVLALCAWRRTDRNVSAIHYCCWKPSSIRNIFTVPFIVPPIGCMWAIPVGSGVR
ncbi:Druantia anti-phage system protein DruA, partial [Thiolapillus sp.]